MRQAGILLSISSLPSKFGIGDFGSNSFKFVKLLKKSKIKIWQILPLNPIGMGNSPYQSICGNAIDYLYISLEDLINDLNINYDLKPYYIKSSNRINYDLARTNKLHVLKDIFNMIDIKSDKDFDMFLNNNSWVEGYAKYTILSIKNNNIDWWNWKEEEKNEYYNNSLDFSKYEDDILFYEWIQYVAYKQYFKLKEFANKNNIKIMGDIPFYVGGNSFDMWSNQDEFLLNENDEPDFIAGCPPDYFSEDGQRWGNPIYDWDYMEEDNFSFWLKRIDDISKLYDILRIDHFRAFDTYRKIPSNSPTARIGEWCYAPGRKFLKKLLKSNIKSEIICEDLGDLFPSVGELRDEFHLCGMKICEFSILDKNEKIRRKQVLYTGTHDNDTIMGWYETLDIKEKKELNKILRKNKVNNSDKLNKNLIEYCFKSKANISIIPMQDILGLDSYYRMNTPGTCGSPNWEFKLKNFGSFSKEINFIKSLVIKYNR